MMAGRVSWKVAGGAATHPAFWQEIKGAPAAPDGSLLHGEPQIIALGSDLCNNETFASMRGNDLARWRVPFFLRGRERGFFFGAPASFARSAETTVTQSSARLRQSAGGGGGGD